MHNLACSVPVRQRAMTAGEIARRSEHVTELVPAMRSNKENRSGDEGKITFHFKGIAAAICPLSRHAVPFR